MRCNLCKPCFTKKCEVCINCLPNSAGKRQHKKCKRQICIWDRKPIAPNSIGKVTSSTKRDINEIVLKIKSDKRNIRKAKVCTNPKKSAKELSNIIA